MADMFFLTDADRRLIADAITLMRKLRINPANLPVHDELDLQPPETYVALTPAGGIPANDVQAGSGGAGTGGSVNGATPGAAECWIYRLDHSTGDLAYAGFTKRVCNASTNAVGGNEWINIGKDKWGVWWATDLHQGGGGSSSLQVEDQSVTVAGVTEIFIPNINGLYITDNGSGAITLNIEEAQEDRSGVVSDNAQTFNGIKTFVTDGVGGGNFIQLDGGTNRIRAGDQNAYSVDLQFLNGVIFGSVQSISAGETLEFTYAFDDLDTPTLATFDISVTGGIEPAFSVSGNRGISGTFINPTQFTIVGGIVTDVQI